MNSIFFYCFFDNSFVGMFLSISILSTNLIGIDGSMVSRNLSLFKFNSCCLIRRVVVFIFDDLFGVSLLRELPVRVD